MMTIEELQKRISVAEKRLSAAGHTNVRIIVQVETESALSALIYYCVSPAAGTTYDYVRGGTAEELADAIDRQVEELGSANDAKLHVWRQRMDEFIRETDEMDIDFPEGCDPAEVMREEMRKLSENILEAPK